MSFGAEVTGKLGIDTSSVPADLAKAKNAFNQFGQQLQTDSAAHGAGAGDKLIGALEHRLTGSRHLAGALSTALGLNFEHIAEHITSAIVGGTKEAWKQAGDISEENAKLIEKRIELALSPKGLQEKIRADAKRAAEEAQGAGKDTNGEKLITKLSPTNAFADNIKKLGQLFGVVRSDAERLQTINEATHKTLETDVRLEEQKKEIKESHRKLGEYEKDLAEKNLSGTKLIAELDARRAEIQEEIKGGKLSEIEVDERKKHFDDLGVQAQAEKNRLTQVGLDKEKELLRLRVTLGEAQRKLADEEQELANKKADRGKETIDEIAGLKAHDTSAQFGQDTHVDTFGLSEDQAKAKETAVEIQRLQKQAEGLRTSGDVGGANAIFDQIGAKKKTLVDSGFAKSTEADDFKELKETIHKDSMEVQKILTETQDVLKGKLKNE